MLGPAVALGWGGGEDSSDDVGAASIFAGGYY